MVDCSIFPTAGQLQRWADEELDEALAGLVGLPVVTLENIEAALAGKVREWHYTPAFAEGWATSEEDCEKLRAWEPIQVRIHSRGRNGSHTLHGVTLNVLFPRCTECRNCSCGAACREVV